MIEKHIFSRVISNEKIARDTYVMVLTANDDIMTYFRPGQFAHIKLPASASRLLRRPISVNYADYAEKTLHFAYLITGEGTKRLSHCAAGDQLDILAPLGQGFKVKDNHRKIWLVGGGIGIAPLLTLGNFYKDREYSAFLGYKSREYAYQTADFENFCKHVFIASDDGTIGERDFVTTVLQKQLEKEKPDLILSCGPLPMFRALKKVWEQAGADVDTQVSMEQHMGCGVGGCYTCTCMVAGSMKRVCIDGPVFDIREVAL